MENHLLLKIIIFYFSFSFIEIKSSKKKNIVYISYSLDEKFTMYPYVSITSLLENKSNSTIYHIYILIPGNLSFKIRNQFQSFEKLYYNCIIDFLNMGESYSNLSPSSAYYRLKLHELLPNLNRIIYLDGDTIVLKDLSEFYNLSFNDKYLLGRLDKITDELDKFGIYTKTYINTGILLIDLYSLRKFDYSKKFNEYLLNHSNDIKYIFFQDQTVLNYVLVDKIGLIKPKFHMWNYYNDENAEQNNKKFRQPYDNDEFVRDFHNPMIIHYPGKVEKPHKLKIGIYHDEWMKYLIKAEKYF